MAITIQYLITMIILLAGFLYVTSMAVYRKLVGGEDFSMAKYATTFGYTALIGFAAFFTTGLFPDLAELLIRVENFVPVGPEITSLIMAIVFGASHQLLKKETPPVAVTNTMQPVPTAQPPFSSGDGKILGIYGGSARGATPSAVFTCDVNQVPMMFMDLQTVITGKMVYEIIMDGRITIMPQTGVNLAEPVGAVRAYDFWLPQQVRTTGSHVLGIRRGVYSAPEVVLWKDSFTYTINFTGTRFLE